MVLHRNENPLSKSMHIVANATCGQDARPPADSWPVSAPLGVPLTHLEALTNGHTFALDLPMEPPPSCGARRWHEPSQALVVSKIGDGIRRLGNEDKWGFCRRVGRRGCRGRAATCGRRGANLQVGTATCLHGRLLCDNSSRCLASRLLVDDSFHHTALQCHPSKANLLGLLHLAAIGKRLLLSSLLGDSRVLGLGRHVGKLKGKRGRCRPLEKLAPNAMRHNGKLQL